MQLQGKDLYADSGKWLYQGDGASRTFWQSITLANVDNAKYFNECTDEEKLAWEDEYLPKYDELPPEEPQEAEVV